MSPANNDKVMNTFLFSENEKFISLFGKLLFKNGAELNPKSVYIFGSLEGMLFTYKIEQEYVNETREILNPSYVFPLDDKNELLSIHAVISEAEAATMFDSVKKEEAGGTSKTIGLRLNKINKNLYRVDTGQVLPGEKLELSRSYAQIAAFEGNRLRLSLPFIKDESHEAEQKSCFLKGNKNILSVINDECVFTLIIKIKGQTAEGKVESPGWDAKIIEEEDGRNLEIRMRNLPHKLFTLVLSEFSTESLYINGESCGEKRQNFFLGKAPPKIIHNNFLSEAISCFISAGISQNPFMNMLLTGGFRGKRQFPVIACQEHCDPEVILNPAEILAYVRNQYELFYRQGEEFAQIFNYLRKDKKLKLIWEFLEAIKDGLSLEALFAIFLFWILRQDPEAERHKLRPVRYELRDVDKAVRTKIMALLDKWQRQDDR